MLHKLHSRSNHCILGHVNILVGNEAAPKPVLLPDEHHLLDGHILCLWQEQRNEDSHDNHPAGEEEEEPKFEVAEQVEERLADHEREEHVHRHIDALPRRPNLEGADLGGHEPP
jgi:hypothetical protein